MEREKTGVTKTGGRVFLRPLQTFGSLPFSSAHSVVPYSSSSDSLRSERSCFSFGLLYCTSANRGFSLLLALNIFISSFFSSAAHDKIFRSPKAVIEKSQ